MPSFPASVWSPTVKSAGNVIDASHINDPQDEIVAIEGGYLNGTARLNSSQSTVVSLSVSSNSTFALRPTMPPPDAAVVFLASTVTIGSSQLSTVAWLAQSVVVNSSMHSTGTNPERLIPQSTGLYQVMGNLALASTEAGVYRIGILDSSNTEFASHQAQGSSRGIVLHASGLKRFDVVGGYAVLAMNLVGHTTMSLSTGLNQSYFTMVKL